MDNQEEFMEIVLDHFENPRNYGALESADVTVEGGNRGCGDTIRVSLNIDSEGRAREIFFSAQGCMLSLAAASIVIEKLKGKVC